jgi:hypothetical protein
MDYKKRERIENMLNFVSFVKLKEAINGIADQMIEDGFEYSDVKEYIIDQLDEILGK